MFISFGAPTESRRARVVYVGQRFIENRIRQHRRKCSKVLRTVPDRNLRVTWARVDSQEDRNCIESFLAEYLHPVVGDRWPGAYPIQVNLPEW